MWLLSFEQQLIQSCSHWKPQQLSSFTVIFNLAGLGTLSHDQANLQTKVALPEATDLPALPSNSALVGSIRLLAVTPKYRCQLEAVHPSDLSSNEQSNMAQSHQGDSHLELAAALIGTGSIMTPGQQHHHWLKKMEGLLLWTHSDKSTNCCVGALFLWLCFDIRSALGGWFGCKNVHVVRLHVYMYTKLS